MFTYWEQQFSLRQLLPDFDQWLVWMARESTGVAEALALKRVAYGGHPRQWVEIGGTSDAVLPVFLHGGYWRALEAETHRFALPMLQEVAGACANVEYRLLPEVTLAECVDDAEAAIKCIAAETGAKLQLIGHSAGAHLAMMGALRCPEIVKGVVAISGLFDLTPLPYSFLSEEVGLGEQDIAGLSPQELWRGTADHVSILYGAHETPEFIRQSQMFVATYNAHLVDVPDRHHMSVLSELTNPGSLISAEINRQFNALT